MAWLEMLRRRYPQVADTVPTMKNVLKNIGKQNHPPNGVLELEARLGTMRSSGFKPGVNPQFFDACIRRFETFDNWIDDNHDGRLSHDVYYYLEQKPGSLDAERMLIHTTMEFQPDGTYLVQHVAKTRWALEDFIFEPQGEIPPGRQYDIRMSMSWEEPVPDELIPESVTHPQHARIKLRKSYTHESSNGARWRYDMTKTWVGKTLEEAERHQASGRAEQCVHEIELECLDPSVYLETADPEGIGLSISMMLKMRDLIGAEVPYRWVPRNQVR